MDPNKQASIAGRKKKHPKTTNIEASEKKNTKFITIVALAFNNVAPPPLETEVGLCISSENKEPGTVVVPFYT